ncbi:MAG: YifB family Mg chelatase-like AAA ATPase, partial [Hyphomicrobiales bacterium]
DLISAPVGEASAPVAGRVAAARERQRARFAALAVPHLRTNAEADGDILEQIAAPDAAGTELLRQAADRMRLSARGFHRVLRVARTLADLAGREKVTRVDIAEALSYRQTMGDVAAAA